MHHVLLLGAGTMGSVHARSYAAMENVTLVGIVEVRKEKAEELGLGVPVFGSYEEAMASLPRVDIVDVCLPTYMHKTYVKKAANDGKHVICEKPLARHLADAREMIDYCKEKNVKLFVGHVLRFFPEYEKSRALVHKGEIGDVAVARTFRGGIFPTAWNDWYADHQNSGGLVLDMIIHDFDFLRWSFGDVERVYAKSLLGRGFARMDYALVTLRFKSGMIAHVEGSWAHEGFAMKMELAGKSGIINYDSSQEKPLIAVSRAKQQGVGGVAVPESPLNENPYFRELKHFIHCIETGGDSLVTAEDAYKAMEIALAAIKSIETGEVVTLS
ncbi:gfo/Idh/MocA family oxidoreductase [Brevibacillus fluminis]|uniref:Gfo/Idh/MocA family oxidoreductase n=1 Tax=Brevibacillus fluminis TaxID=511487 RepID=A0A3M8DH37_9BACL|nr:Gfo/Idh/MocA family oxidoreductase [Brevibacillus fluminis]RNB87410.1 gfo/Idh/MocA family oxidoreductase [Brevibacillus fluminis]